MKLSVLTANSLVFLALCAEHIDRHLAGGTSDVAGRVPDAAMQAEPVFLQLRARFIVRVDLAIDAIVVDGDVGLRQVYGCGGHLGIFGPAEIDTRHGFRPT